MKKICFVSTVGSTLKIFVLELAKYLYNTGEYEVYFMCKPDKILLDAIPDYIKLIPVEMKRGISLDAFRVIRQMKKEIKKNKFDIIQYSTPNASCYASIAAYMAKTPVRLYCQWGIAYVGFSGLKRKLLKQEEKLVCRLSTWIEPDSKSNLEFSHNEGLYPEKKGAVIWNGSASGVDLTRFDIAKKRIYNDETRKQYNIPEEAFVFGFVGRITKDKGINELFSATKALMKTHDDAWLLIVGRNDKIDSVDVELNTWAHNNERVVFSGFTNTPEKLIASMNCFVLPSYREGFGMSVVEAEAMGVPVIISDIPGPIDGMKEGKTGLIVPVKDEMALMSAMEKMINSEELCKELGKNGVEFVSKSFDQKELFLRIYQDRNDLLSKYCDSAKER